MTNQMTRSKPSVERPWMKYYPPMLADLRVPECTLWQYLTANCPGEDVTAIHYYGVDIPWKTVFETANVAAAGLRALGFGEGDQIPVFLCSVPEFVYLLLAAEKIGASLLCRDNTLDENVEAVAKSGTKNIFAHTYLTGEALNAYLTRTATERVVLIDPLESGDINAMPEHVRRNYESFFTDDPAGGAATLSWDEFLALGRAYKGKVDAEQNIDRPLLRAYTSGSTGPSKQVIHSAHTIIGVLTQMNFYGAGDGFRPSWLVTCLPPALIAVVVSMILLPLASNKYLILDPYCAPEDVDLEMMRYRPNCWPLIPMFIETIMRSKRVPADYDLSHLFSAGAGCEAFNNNQMRRAQQFLYDHNCNTRFTVGYGCSEAGSNITLPMTDHELGNGNVGIPMPLNNMGIFKPGTQEELGYNEIGEICVSGPGNMLGYDDPASTAKALQLHDDGKVWLHVGDIGYVTEDGLFHTMTRGESPRFGGGDLMIQPMENLIADADIKGIKDEFVVVAPDLEHKGYYLPYVYVVLRKGYTLDDVRDGIMECLEPHQRPVEIFAVPERPFFHFKTNRIGLIGEICSAADR
ncbi:MAG: acyl--CoA ligase [Clostridia bacterium]|nr:acyl--CoA ligase [Clostridia bacterium]